MQDKSLPYRLGQTTLVVGGTLTSRNAWAVDTTTRLTIPQWNKVAITSANPSIGIADVRQFQQAISRLSDNDRPMVGVIDDADRLTIEAQNALLKTLEEPPLHALIILLASDTAVLLPTIVSRCTIVLLPNASEFSNEDKLAWRQTWQSIQSGSIGQRLTSIDAAIPGRDEAVRFVDCGIYALSHTLNDSDSTTALVATKTLRRFLTARDQLKRFATPRLVIDTLVLYELF